MVLNPISDASHNNRLYWKTHTLMRANTKLAKRASYFSRSVPDITPPPVFTESELKEQDLSHTSAEVDGSQAVGDGGNFQSNPHSC